MGASSHWFCLDIPIESWRWFGYDIVPTRDLQDQNHCFPPWEDLSNPVCCDLKTSLGRVKSWQCWQMSRECNSPCRRCGCNQPSMGQWGDLLGILVGPQYESSENGPTNPQNIRQTPYWRCRGAQSTPDFWGTQFSGMWMSGMGMQKSWSLRSNGTVHSSMQKNNQ